MTETSETNGHYPPEAPLGVFTVEIAAPGGSSASWRPFPAQELSLSEHARKIIERFEFKAEVIELAAHHDADTSRPGIILIDPRLMTLPGGRAELQAAVTGLPPWVLPLLVVSQPSDPKGDYQAEQVRDILLAAGDLRARSARRGARGASSLRAFELLMRDLVCEAEAQYIRHRSRKLYGAEVTSRPSSRSGSSVPPQHDRFASASDRLGETPDAR